MEPKVLLTVDLSYIIKNEQENIFNSELCKRKWERIYTSTPIWKTRINHDSPEEVIIKKAKEDITSAADAAGIKRIGAEIYFNGGYSVIL